MRSIFAEASLFSLYKNGIQRITKAPKRKHTTDEISDFRFESEKDFLELSESHFDDNLDTTGLSPEFCESENGKEIVDLL